MDVGFRIGGEGRAGQLGAPAAYSTLTAPGSSALFVPLAFFGLNLCMYRYLLWQSGRHQTGLGTHALEKVALGFVMVLALLGLLVALAIAFLVGLAVDWIV